LYVRAFDIFLAWHADSKTNILVNRVAEAQRMAQSLAGVLTNLWPQCV
jgi:hypothetical protein